MHEALFRRDINEESVKRPAAQVPARTVLPGTGVTLEPLDPERHTVPLCRAGHSTEEALRSWRYLPWGPFSDELELHGQLRNFATDLNRIFYAICNRATGDAVGMATYLDIQPIGGVIEIGGIWFAPRFMRSRGATESLFLMLSYAMDDLGYRRMRPVTDASKRFFPARTDSAETARPPQSPHSWRAAGQIGKNRAAPDHANDPPLAARLVSGRAAA